MQNSSKKYHTNKPYSQAVYTDSDINGLLDTIARLQEENQFLLREHERIVMICRAMKLNILHLRSANESQSLLIEKLQQRTHQ